MNLFHAPLLSGRWRFRLESLCNFEIPSRHDPPCPSGLLLDEPIEIWIQNKSPSRANDEGGISCLQDRWPIDLISNPYLTKVINLRLHPLLLFFPINRSLPFKRICRRKVPFLGKGWKPIVRNRDMSG